MKFTWIISFAVAVLLTGCAGGKQEAETHEHSGPEPVVFTRYADSTELFVEFSPLIAGQTSKFATHITRLGQRFEALREGSVRVILNYGSAAISDSSEKPSVPGIYRLQLTPQLAGKAILTFEIKTTTFTERHVFKNITVYPNQQAAIDAGHSHPSGDEVSYLKEQAWKTTFANTPVVARPLSTVIRASGELVPATGSEQIVVATSDGVVQFHGPQTVAGASVKKGTKLFTITAGAMSGSNVDIVYQETRARYEKSKADFERMSELVKDKIVSQKDYLASKQEFENAQRAFQNVSRNYQSGGQSVPSPADGFIRSISVSEGQFVTAGTPLAVVSGGNRLLLRAFVSQSYFSNLSAVRSANFRTASGDVFDTDKLEGRMLGYGKSASADQPFIPVTFEITNNGDFLPGSTVEVFLKAAPGKDALVIPYSSLLEEQGSFFVYVQTGGESFRKKEVHIGASDGEYVEITDGLKAGERAVSKGAYQIKLATAAGAMPEHGHEH